jgi:hypothetical protein
MPKWLNSRDDILKMLSFGEPHVSECEEAIRTELQNAVYMRELNSRPTSTDQELKMCVEALTYIEATRAGKGWWFRAKKRVELTKQYLI